MFPPSPASSLDIEALSGICGSISIACWVVVFSPQIIENFRRGSADGLSLVFLIVWLAGDVFNILGAVMQGVLPTMIILAVYYTLADIVLLCQCFYYRGFTLSDEPPSARSARSSGTTRQIGEYQEAVAGATEPSERSALLAPEHDHADHHNPAHRRPSLASFREGLSRIDSTHLSPAMPLVVPEPPNSVMRRKPSTFKIVIFNTFAIGLVCAAGVFGWYVSIWSSPSGNGPSERKAPDVLTLDLWGQIFGYLCAALYLFSRIPQLLLNWRRKSTEGVSLLFFLFACIGNLTYVLSIFAYSPVCEGGKNGECRRGEELHIYARYILVNASWLLGSLGTLILDLSIFAQFIAYRAKDNDAAEEYEEEGLHRPVAST